MSLGRARAAKLILMVAPLTLFVFCDRREAKTPVVSMAEAPPAVTVAPAPKRPLGELERTTVAEWVRAFNAHDTAKLAAFYGSDANWSMPFTDHWFELRGASTIADGYAGWMFRVLPDAQMTANRVFQAGDVVVVEWAIRGTNKGELDGEQGTGKAVGIRGASIEWFNDDGRIVKEHVYYDGMTLRQQAGRIAGKPRPPVPGGVTATEWIVATGSPEENALAATTKELWPASWLKRDGKAYEESLTDDAVHEDLVSPTDAQGRAANGKVLAAYAEAFPDMAITVENTWPVGPHVLVEFTMTGTMKGPFGSLKAANKPITLHAFDVDAFRGDKIARRTTYNNGVALLAATGSLPAAKTPAVNTAPTSAATSGASNAAGGSAAPASTSSAPAPSPASTTAPAAATGAASQTTVTIATPGGDAGAGH